MEHPRQYLQPQFEFIKDSGKLFPVGKYKDLQISFVHYQTEEEAVEKWIERAKRIVWDNIYVIATGHNGLEVPELMERFDKLPYKNRVMFTHHFWPQYSWAKHVKMFEEVDDMPPLTEFATMDGKRIYDTAFDLAKWIADCEKQKG